jgi:hypothetical protein
MVVVNQKVNVHKNNNKLFFLLAIFNHLEKRSNISDGGGKPKGKCTQETHLSLCEHCAPCFLFIFSSLPQKLFTLSYRMFRHMEH